MVTVPGGNGVIIAIPYTSGDNAAAADALLQNLYHAAVSEQNVVDYSSTGSHAAIAGDVNLLIADTAGTAVVPTGFQYLIDGYDTQTVINNGTAEQQPLTPFLAGGNLNGSEIVSSTNGLQYGAGTGVVTIVAGGNVNLSTLPTGTPGGVLYLDGIGTEDASLASGNWQVVTGTGSGQFTLGNGVSSIYAQGTDTIRGGSGPATVDLAASGEALYGGAGTEVVTVDAPGDTIDAGAGRSTVTANSAGLTLTGSGAEILFVDKSGDNHLIGNTSGLVIFASPHGGSTYEASNSYVLFISEGGSDTIDAAAGKNGPVVFGAPGGDVHVNAAAGGTFVASGGGPETVDASGSSQGAVFFSGTGDIDMIGAPNAPNFYAANVGQSTMSGGAGNVYDFIDGHSGNTNLITGFGPNDSLYLTGFGLGANDGIANEVVTNGTLGMTLTDGTQITFQNLSSASQLSGQIYHN